MQESFGDVCHQCQGQVAGVAKGHTMEHQPEVRDRTDLEDHSQNGDLHPWEMESTQRMSHSTALCHMGTRCLAHPSEL